MVLADTTHGAVKRRPREAILTGRLVKLRRGDAAADDLANNAGWDTQRTVAAAVLAELIIAPTGRVGIEWYEARDNIARP